jgi:hypothetical protein
LSPDGRTLITSSNASSEVNMLNNEAIFQGAYSKNTFKQLLRNPLRPSALAA